ncbi:hypothetical protein AHAS_Ahas12G0158000 [Arachis hypogaea]
MPPRQHAGCVLVALRHLATMQQHASCVLMSLRHLSSMQQHAGCVLPRVGMKEASPPPGTSVINGGGGVGDLGLPFIVEGDEGGIFTH